MENKDRRKPPQLYRAHPWHGIAAGPFPPEVVNVFVEVTPSDLVKYEVDKVSGYLTVNRPQRGLPQSPALYGFIPRTYCGERVQGLSPGSTVGDGDALDIVVLCETPITRNEIVVRARVVGGLKMVDSNEADDKIIAVLENDLAWGSARDIGDLPQALLERLEHCFLTYKLVPGREATVGIKCIYGCRHAFEVVNAALEDYQAAFGTDSGQN